MSWTKIIMPFQDYRISARDPGLGCNSPKPGVKGYPTIHEPSLNRSYLQAGGHFVHEVRSHFMMRGYRLIRSLSFALGFYCRMPA